MPGVGDPKHRLVTYEVRSQGADVLVVTNLWPRDDQPFYGIFVKRQVDALVAAGLACDVLFVRGYRSSLAYPLAALRLLALSLLRRPRYRVVHAHGGETAPFARAYVRAPLVASYLGSDVNGKPDAQGRLSVPARVKSAALRYFSRFATVPIVKSEEMRRRLPSGTGGRTVILAITPDRRLFAPTEREEARRRLGWSPTDLVALFAADPEIGGKRAWLARAACQEAGRLGVKIQLRVAHRVDPDDMPLHMSAADCLLLTSVSEGSPNVVKEAIAVNLPVVSTPVGDVAQQLAAVEPSAICEPTPQSLAEGILRCASGARSNGRELTARLDDGSATDRLLAIYRQLGARSVASDSR